MAGQYPSNSGAASSSSSGLMANPHSFSSGSSAGGGTPHGALNQHASIISGTMGPAMPTLGTMVPGLSGPLQLPLPLSNGSNSAHSVSFPSQNGAGGVSGTCEPNQTQQSNPNRLAAAAAASTSADAPPPPQASRDLNTASLCRIGQETVHDIVSRTQEIFNTLRMVHLPNGFAGGVAGISAANEKKVKVQEQLRAIKLLFKRLRLVYEKCNDNNQLQGMEYTHIESLIPLKDEWDGKADERKNSESYRQAVDEQKELMEANAVKNVDLKEVIDQMRRIIWEINTMLMMRRS